jgi:hypothetical protein
MRVCSDCKEEDRKYTTNYMYRCCNDYCEWYIEPTYSKKIEYEVKNITRLPKIKISDYYFTDYIIKGKQGIFRRFI